MRYSLPSGIGVAPPLIHRTVFISNRSVRALKPGTTIGKPDTDFVRMFVHELAHIALYEQCGGVDVVRSLFEAGIAGLPAVAMDVGGVAECIRANETGIGFTGAATGRRSRGRDGRRRMCTMILWTVK